MEVWPHEFPMNLGNRESLDQLIDVPITIWTSGMSHGAVIISGSLNSLQLLGG